MYRSALAPAYKTQKAPDKHRRVLVVNDRWDVWSSYHAPFSHLGQYTANFRMLEYSPELISCVVFTGGADVDPKHYGHEPCRMTSCSEWRDDFEIEIFHKVRELGLPMFGICRGAQLLCVLSGGTLCQHLERHAGADHLIRTHDGRTIAVNSLHHQMMMPGEGAEILAWADPKLSSYHLGSGGSRIEVRREIEVVHFPKTNALAVQYHPELLGEHEEGWAYYQELIAEFLDQAQRSREATGTATMLRGRAA